MSRDASASRERVESGLSAMTDQPPAGPIVPDLSIPFDRAIVEIIAKPPFDRAGATAAEAGGLIIRQLTTDALAASGLGGPTRDHVISAQETAIGFACWGAVRFAAELAEDGSTTQPADFLTSYLDEISAGYEARSEEHTSELQSPDHLVCRLLLEKKKKTRQIETRDHPPRRVLLEKKL